MRNFKISLILFGLLLSGGCSTDTTEMTPTDGGKVRVAIRQSATIKTRTAIDDDGHTAIWAPDDQIAIWAQAADGTFALSAQQFILYRFNSSYTSATFTAFVTPLEEGSYTYYATHPTPSSTNGMQATFNVSAEQNSSEFVGGYDIMVATPSTNAALTSAEETNLNLRFTHKMHALKFTIPEGHNLMGKPVTRIEFTFPTEVTGDVTVDASNPSVAATLANGSRSLNVNMSQGINEGDTFWAMIFPTEISGEISYIAYSGDYKSFSRKVSLTKNAQEGHITPISLVIPELFRQTTLSFYIQSNLLGEDIKNVTIMDAAGQNVVATTTYNAETNSFDIVLDGMFDDTPYSNKTFTACFESEHAKVYNTFTTPKLTPYVTNSIGLDVPYLYFEDFADVGSFESHSSYDRYDSDFGSKDAVSFCNGWTAARVGASAGKSIRLAARRETTANYPSRADSAPLSCITKSTRIKITFNYGMNRSEGGIYFPAPPALGLTCKFGYVTSTTAYKSGDSTGTFAGGDHTFSLNATEASYDVIPNKKTFYLDGRDASTRLTWWIDAANKNDLTNGTYYLYIDNITVQIAQ